ncbi:glycosyltransferase [Salegentibacter chungangensis]|uniref:Glycosyltransferase n=1 Tax=Salegentibacter chungangensis TaxID=1335724 RepID=A0ABW3NNB2_9FLAO
MKQLRIAFLVPAFPTISETFIVNQIVELKERGHQVMIFAFQKNETENVQELVKEFRLMESSIFHHLPTSGKPQRYLNFFQFLIDRRKDVDFKRLFKIFSYKNFGKKAFNLSYFTRYQWMLEQGEFDIIHAHFGQSGAYVAEMKAYGYLKSAKLITTFHGYDIHPAKLEQYKSVYRDLFAFSDVITCNTPYTFSLLDKLGFNKPARVLPVDLDTSRFKPASIRRSKNKFLLLFVGRLVKFKAAQLTVEILNILNDRGYTNSELVIIGEGPEKNKVLELINKYGFQERVLLTGALKQADIINFMNKADVFLFPGITDSNGRAENQGLVIQEAQAMELPVIVSDAGGMKYGMLNGETGFVVKKNDLETFADKVEELINNEALRIEMGKKGRKFVIENYDSKILGTQLENIYNTALTD